MCVRACVRACACAPSNVIQYIFFTSFIVSDCERATGKDLLLVFIVLCSL